MSVKLSSKHQIVIPREARDRLKLKSGDRLEIVVRNEVILVFPKPRSWERAIRGLGRGVFAPDHVEKERRSWD